MHAIQNAYQVHILHRIYTQCTGIIHHLMKERCCISYQFLVPWFQGMMSRLWHGNAWICESGTKVAVEARGWKPAMTGAWKVYGEKLQAASRGAQERSLRAAGSKATGEGGLTQALCALEADVEIHDLVFALLSFCLALVPIPVYHCLLLFWNGNGLVWLVYVGSLELCFCCCCFLTGAHN